MVESSLVRNGMARHSIHVKTYLNIKNGETTWRQCVYFGTHTGAAASVVLATRVYSAAGGDPEASRMRDGRPAELGFPLTEWERDFG